MIKEYKNYSLLKHNTFGFNVKAKRFIEYDSASELKEFIEAGCLPARFLHIGAGSNLLFRKDYGGTILHSKIEGYALHDDGVKNIMISVGPGVVWDEFVEFCVNNKWYGLENLSGIPGEVGASAVQNIGAYGVEAKDLITSVCTLNSKGEERRYTRDECNFSYRHSLFKEPGMEHVIITRVCFHLRHKEEYTLDYGTVREELDKFPDVTLKNVRRAILNIRNAKLPDPKIHGNAGSFFMNPVVSRMKFEELKAAYPDIPHYEVDDDHVKIPAGWMIEQCGWKGKSLGNAAVHAKQALVLINTGEATGEDVVALSDAVRKAVDEKFGINIRPEVKIIE